MSQTPKIRRQDLPFEINKENKNNNENFDNNDIFRDIKLSEKQKIKEEMLEIKNLFDYLIKTMLLKINFEQNENSYSKKKLNTTKIDKNNHKCVETIQVQPKLYITRLRYSPDHNNLLRQYKS